MYKSPSNTHQVSMFWDLASMLNLTHPMYKLANLINWETFERSFAPLYCKDNGRMAKPIRLMVGLIVLKHIRNVSDESVVEQFSENAYYQYFCGMESFTIAKPCVPTELVEFRHRIGETNIMIPGVPKASDSPHKKKKKQRFFRKRAGIEPVIGHCKADHRLGRNFYKGLLGDAINVMLAAAAFNFKRAMRLLLCLIRTMIKWSIQGVDSNFNETKVLSNTICWL
ncbi:transposase [Prevotella corporis]|uniref:transposase n=1 Tax=Prevotella corporis TaxID=28128 RepID=UPI0023653DC6|nr:transposase [Prevotella corporis]